MIRLIAAAVAALALSGAAYAQAAKPFDFRGVPLGITMEAFRALPAPAGIGEGGPISIECWADEHDATATLCHWQEAGSGVDLRLGAGWSGATFYFIPDSDGATKLWKIVVGSDTGNFAAIRDGLVKRFGPPSASTRGKAVTGLGVSTPQNLMVWSNASSSINVLSPAGTITSMMALYEHTRLGALVASRKPKPQGM